QARRQTHPQGLAHPLGHAGAGHAHLASNRGDGVAGMIVPQNLGPLHFPPRRRLRPTELFELLRFRLGQHQLRTPRFPCHAAKHIRKAGPCEHLLTKRYTRLTSVSLKWRSSSILLTCNSSSLDNVPWRNAMPFPVSINIW